MAIIELVKDGEKVIHNYIIAMKKQSAKKNYYLFDCEIRKSRKNCDASGDNSSGKAQSQLCAESRQGRFCSARQYF